MIITLDFETYWAQGYTLRKQTTEEYIRDKRFEIIGVGIKVDGAQTEWHTGTHEELKVSLAKYDWANSILVCHNTMFDGAILKWILGIEPELYIDTLSMARAHHGIDVGGSLASLAIKYNLGVKGTEVINAKEKRLTDFSSSDLALYGEYCVNDVELTYALYKILIADFPHTELSLIDMTLRMFIFPVLKVDDAMLVDRLEEVKEEKQLMLSALKEKLNCETDEEVRKKLASNKQFAELLVELGIKPPMKISKTTGKEAFALAKTDIGFIELSEHDDEFVQQLCAVRLGTKSTIEESRLERFIGIGERNKGYLPIPLKYYGAHTGRWSGMDSINAQNLPSRDKKKKALKNSITAEDGYVVINCDSSQIEARVLAWLAGQDDVVEQFANNEDVYSIFASKIYDKPISKANPIERFVGKTCIAEGTPVLCESGWKLIEEVTTNDRLWDGEEWVCHQGLVNNGYKKTLELYGTSLTPDHLVWLGTHWKEAQYLESDLSTLFQALVTGAGNLPLRAISKDFRALRRLLLNATAVKKSTLWTTITLKTLKVLGVAHVLKKRLVKKGIGYILRPFLMTSIEQDYSIDCLQPLPDATIRTLSTTNTMGKEAYMCFRNGEKIKQFFLGMSRHWMGGISQSLKWIEQIITKGTSQITLDLCPVVVTLKINDKSQTLKNVYDILNCGSRNRFTILTDRGPLIVHNCILGLGFGTGAAKLQHTLQTQPPGAELSVEECEDIVKLYRSTNDKIISLWKDGDDVVKDLVDWEYTNFATNVVTSKTPYWYGEHECLQISKEGIRLPNGLYIRYPQLHLNTDEAKSYHAYKSRAGMKSIWGGALVENVVQALARIIVGEQMLLINERYKPALTVHDAAVCVIPEAELEEAEKFIVDIMSTPPLWAKGLPIACEFTSGISYGNCG
jgi:DNA polymerase